MQLRIATIQDLSALVDGNARMARETEDIGLDPQVLGAGVRAVLEGRQPGQYRVAEIEGRIAGQLLITWEWSDWRNKTIWWIQSVYVMPDARRHGVYRALYRWVLEDARRDGAGGVRLYVDQRNTRAQQVYRSLGMDGGHYQVFEAMFGAGN